MGPPMKLTLITILSIICLTLSAPSITLRLLMEPQP